MYQIVNYYHENNQAITDFKLKSRFLWDDHISYTRNAIISILSNLPDAYEISSRLIKNQEDIGEFISPYYSITQVFTLVNLLKEHISIATKVITGIEGSIDSWKSNGNDITLCMSQMNKLYWPESVTSPMWKRHLDLTIAEISSRKGGLWAQDVKAYDDNHQCMSEFADVFSNGVILQNIDMFCFPKTRN